MVVPSAELAFSGRRPCMAEAPAPVDFRLVRVAARRQPYRLAAFFAAFFAGLSAGLFAAS
jgi:hypothetical protein